MIENAALYYLVIALPLPESGARFSARAGSLHAQDSISGHAQGFVSVVETSPSSDAGTGEHTLARTTMSSARTTMSSGHGHRQKMWPLRSLTTPRRPRGELARPNAPP
jgi:hypothetical protein